MNSKEWQARAWKKNLIFFASFQSFLLVPLFLSLNCPTIRMVLNFCMKIWNRVVASFPDLLPPRTFLDRAEKKATTTKYPDSKNRNSNYDLWQVTSKAFVISCRENDLTFLSSWIGNFQDFFGARRNQQQRRGGGNVRSKSKVTHILVSSTHAWTPLPYGACIYSVCYTYFIVIPPIRP